MQPFDQNRPPPFDQNRPPPLNPNRTPPLHPYRAPPLNPNGSPPFVLNRPRFGDFGQNRSPPLPVPHGFRRGVQFAPAMFRNQFFDGRHDPMLVNHPPAPLPQVPQNMGLPRRVAQDQAEIDRVIDEVLNIVDDVDRAWLREHSGYPVGVLIDYVFEHPEEVARVQIDNVEHDRIMNISADSLPSPVVRAVPRVFSPITPSTRGVEQALLAELFRAPGGRLSIKLMPSTDKTRLASFLKTEFHRVKVAVLSEMPSRFDSPLLCFCFVRLIDSNMIDGLKGHPQYVALTKKHPSGLTLTGIKNVERRRLANRMNLPQSCEESWRRYQRIVEKAVETLSKVECSVCFDEAYTTDSLSCTLDLAKMDDIPDQQNAGASNVTHDVCVDCIRGMCASLCEDGRVAPGGIGLCCVDPSCTQIIPWASVKPLLGKDVRRRLEKRLDTEATMMLDGVEKCKYCSFAAVIDSPVEILRVFDCNRCKAKFCRECKMDWKLHFGLKCAEAAAKNKDAGRKQLEDELAMAIMRTCHRCKLVFAKADGCNKMTCRCGATQCYICRTTDIDYKHFCPHMRDPNQPMLCPNNCPLKCLLWTKGEDVDAAALADVRNRAQDDERKREFLGKM